MNISLLPVKFVVHDLIHFWIGKLNVVGIGIDEVAEFEPVTDVHEQTPLSVSVSEGHFRIQIGILVGRSGRLVRYNGRVDQVAVTDERHVPESPETNVYQRDSTNRERESRDDGNESACNERNKQTYLWT